MMSAETYRGFRFRYVHDQETQGKIRVYVEQQPSYNRRDTSPHVIHRWPARNGAPPYICFKDEHKPATFRDAQRLAHDWANRTATYIRTGVSISQQILRGW